MSILSGQVNVWSGGYDQQFIGLFTQLFGTNQINVFFALGEIMIWFLLAFSLVDFVFEALSYLAYYRWNKIADNEGITKAIKDKLK